MKLVLVLKNQLYYWRTVVPVIFFCGLFLLLAGESYALVVKMNALSSSTLANMKTDLILQESQPAKSRSWRPRGLTVPPSLPVFSYQSTARKLNKVAPPAEISGALTLWQMSPKGTVALVAVDPKLPAVGAGAVKSLIIKGRFFARAGAAEIVLERHFSKLFGYKPGDNYTVGAKKLKIVGIIDFKNNSNLSGAAAFVPYRTGLNLAGLDGDPVNQVFIHLGKASDIPKVKETIAAELPDARVITQDSLVKNLTGINSIINKFGAYFVAGMMAVTALAVFMGIRFYLQDFADQRRVLRVLGWDRWNLLKWQALEVTIVLFLAAALATAGHTQINKILADRVYISSGPNQGATP